MTSAMVVVTGRRQTQTQKVARYGNFDMSSWRDGVGVGHGGNSGTGWLS